MLLQAASSLASAEFEGDRVCAEVLEYARALCAAARAAPGLPPSSSWGVRDPRGGPPRRGWRWGDYVFGCLAQADPCGVNGEGVRRDVMRISEPPSPNG